MIDLVAESESKSGQSRYIQHCILRGGRMFFENAFFLIKSDFRFSNFNNRTSYHCTFHRSLPTCDTAVNLAPNHTILQRSRKNYKITKFGEMMDLGSESESKSGQSRYIPRFLKGETHSSSIPSVLGSQTRFNKVIFYNGSVHKMSYATTPSFELRV